MQIVGFPMRRLILKLYFYNKIKPLNNPAYKQLYIVICSSWLAFVDISRRRNNILGVVISLWFTIFIQVENDTLKSAVP